MSPFPHFIPFASIKLQMGYYFLTVNHNMSGKTDVDSGINTDVGAMSVTHLNVHQEVDLDGFSYRNDNNERPCTSSYCEMFLGMM